MRYSSKRVFLGLALALFIFSTGQAQSDSTKLVALAEDGSYTLDGLRLTLRYHRNELPFGFDTTWVGMDARASAAYWFAPWIVPATFKDSVLQMLAPPPYSIAGMEHPKQGFYTTIDTSKHLLIGLHCQHQDRFSMSDFEETDDSLTIDTIPYRLDAAGLHASLSGAELIHRIRSISLYKYGGGGGGGRFVTVEYAYGEPLDSSSNPTFIFTLKGKFSNGIISSLANRDDLSLFPDPCTNEMDLVLGTQRINNPQVRIYDALGRTRMQRTTGQLGGVIDTRSLEAGNYLIEVEGMRKMFVVAR